MFPADRHQHIHIYFTSTLTTQLMSQLSCKYFTKPLISEQPNGYVSVPSHAMRKHPYNPVLTYSSKRSESTFHGLKSQLPKANDGASHPTPVSVALAHKAEPRKHPISLCVVKLTKPFIQATVFSDGVSPSLTVFPQTLFKVTSQSKYLDRGNFPNFKCPNSIHSLSCVFQRRGNQAGLCSDSNIFGWLSFGCTSKDIFSLPKKAQPLKEAVLPFSPIVYFHIPSLC